MGGSVEVPDAECVFCMESVAKAVGETVWSVTHLQDLSKLTVTSHGFGTGPAVHFCDFMTKKAGGTLKVAILIGMELTFVISDFKYMNR